jgi:hypothetical protein
MHFKTKNTLKTTFTIMLNTALITRKEKKMASKGFLVF